MVAIYVLIALLVGAGLGYGFRGYLAKRVKAVGAVAKADVTKAVAKL